MNTKRRVAAVIGSGIAPLLVVGLPAPAASAHGYVSSPPSRQAQCAAGIVDCGSIKYEPQSVEGPKGLRNCHGGNEQFAELNDDGKPWRVTPIGKSATFNWQLTAQHATSTWQYFVAGKKVAEFNDGGARPGATVTHQVDFGGITGRQKVLAVWNIADTANAFYTCVDVNIGGGGGDDVGGDDGGHDDGGEGDGHGEGDGGNGGDGNGNQPGCTVATLPPKGPAAWNPKAIYTGGDTVSWRGHTWRAKWWALGMQPGTTGIWGVWEDLGVGAA